MRVRLSVVSNHSQCLGVGKFPAFFIAMVLHNMHIKYSLRSVSRDINEANFILQLILPYILHYYAARYVPINLTKSCLKNDKQVGQ